VGIRQKKSPPRGLPLTSLAEEQPFKRRRSLPQSFNLHPRPLLRKSGSCGCCGWNFWFPSEVKSLVGLLDYWMTQENWTWKNERSLKKLPPLRIQFKREGDLLPKKEIQKRKFPEKGKRKKIFPILLTFTPLSFLVHNLLPFLEISFFGRKPPVSIFS